jgi:hypothetical protein
VKRRLVLIVIGATVLAFGRMQVWAMPQSPIRQTAAELQQLVAPIALYPDELVAQILAASTYPTQVVEADFWLQQYQNLQGEELAAAVNQQRWDASVKAVTAFPSVVTNMDQNLLWATALGQAYVNQQQDVLDAVQVMRRRAQDAGNLQSTREQRVSTQGSAIVIEPVSADTCYLPVYDPGSVYGAPIEVYPGYIYNPWYGGPYVVFGPAVGLGFFGRFGWGWPAWGFNWDRHVVVFNRTPFISRNVVFVREGAAFRGFAPGFRSFGGNRTFRTFRSGGFRAFAHHR